MEREAKNDPADFAAVRRSAEHRRAEELSLWLVELLQGWQTDELSDKDVPCVVRRSAIVR
jgi:hypothetical protein